MALFSPPFHSILCKSVNNFSFPVKRKTNTQTNQLTNEVECVAPLSFEGGGYQVTTPKDIFVFPLVCGHAGIRSFGHEMTN